jgi:hypothetical protein
MPVHDMFNIEVEVDSWYEYDTVVGVNGTFCEGMHFGYNGVSAINNYFISGEGDAFTILTAAEPDQGYVVAYDEGSYKTIGCSFEFGALVDGASPSTKARLMLEYLTFFGDIVTDVDEYNVLNADAALGNIYPNPFTDQTTVRFKLEKETNVSIDIFSLDGRKIATLIDSEMQAGEHTVKWDGTSTNGQKLSTGIYICTLKTNSVIATQKIILY